MVCAAPLERGRLDSASQRHGDAGGHQQDRDQDRQRHEHETEPAQRVQVKVAQLALAAQAADHRQHDGQPAGRRDELKPHDRAKLAEIREMLLARIMLEVGVGHERADRVEDDGRVGPGMLGSRHVLVAERGQRALAVGVQDRQMALHQQDHERDHEKRCIEGEHREGILLPAHLGRLAMPEQFEQGERNRVDPLADALGRRIEYAGHPPAQRDRTERSAGRSPRTDVTKRDPIQ